MTPFATQLQKLNPAQLAAVNALDGPVMVIAGPGTGKTQVLTYRIANLIAQGLAEPREILALTFTNSAAATMRERLVQLIGQVGLGVNFNTFHGFCQEVIEEQKVALPFAATAQNLDDLEKISFLEKIIRTLDLQILRPAGKKYYYSNEIAAAIANLKQEGVTPEIYQNLLTQARATTAAALNTEQQRKRPRKTMLQKLQQNLAKQEELGQIYTHYQKLLQQNSRYDFADMILTVSQAFKTQPDLAAQYQERFLYLLVDEYQDTNNAQDEIINQLTSYWGEQANLFVVGDPEQSIYRFQGANLENFLGFTKRYPQAQKIVLTTGYRCSNKTYALAHELTLTAPASERFSDARLQNALGRLGTPATLIACPTRDQEILWLLQEIQTLHHAGTPYRDIAIIYRNNKEGERLRELATASQIPTLTLAPQNLLADPYILQVISFLQLLAHLSDSYLAETYLHQLLWQAWLALDLQEILTFQQICRSQKTLLIDLILKPNSSTPTTLKKLGEKLLHLKASSEQLPLAPFVRTALTTLGLLPWLKDQPAALPHLLNLYAFERLLAHWSDATPNFNLAALLERLATIQEHALPLPAPPFAPPTDAVTLVTAHKAKGQEWTHVFTCGLQKNNWDKSNRAGLPLPAGILKQQLTTDASSDNRRLFYVAATRAKEHNYFSWHLTDPTTPEKPCLPAGLTYFLEGWQDAGLTKALTPAPTELSVTRDLQTLLAPPTRQFAPPLRAYFQERVRGLILSASLLNDYLTDLDLFIDRHLLQAPDFTTKVPLEFGNSWHFTLDQVVKAKLTHGQYLPLARAQTLFQKNFTAKNLPEPENSAYLQIGLNSLAHYYQQTLVNLTHPLYCEKSFGFTSPLHLETIPLKGKIDRLDLLDPVTQTISVIDYKTGAAISANQLSGTTSSQLSEREKTLPLCIRSPHKRQLLFYKLLVELEPHFPYQATTGVLDFIKLTPNKKPLTHQIPLLDEDLAALKTLIHTVWQEIQILQFLPPVT